MAKTPRTGPKKRSGAPFARLRAVALLALAALGAPTLASAEPTLDEAVSFARSELTGLCNDSRRSGIDVLDRLKIGGLRTCQVTVKPGRLNLSVRENGSEYSGRAFARLKLDVHFNRSSGFLCGRPGRDGRASLFFTCDASKGANGASCAKRQLTVDHPDRDPLRTRQTLSAAAILRTDPENCRMLVRALSFVSERSKSAPEEDVRDFFAQK